jgi:hypothetical protein
LSLSGANAGDYALSLVGGDFVVARMLTTSSTTTTTTTTTTAPLPNFPGASASYPNGCIVRFGTSYYVFAGGRAFFVPPAELRALERLDHAVVVDAAHGAKAPTGAAPRAGTVVIAYRVNHATLYVAGTNGKFHGFASRSQFLAGGFDPAMVVTVPGLGGAPVAASSAGAAHITALSTKADGALVVSGHSYYVFAGERAFPVPTSADFARLRKADKASPLRGAIGSAEANASLADGVLLSVGPKGVYVSYRGELFPFRSMAQMSADGYGGTAVVPVPSTGGLDVVSPYSGS